MRAAYRNEPGLPVETDTLRYRVSLVEHQENRDDQLHETEVEVRVSGTKKHWKELHDEALALAVKKLFDCPFCVQWTVRKTVVRRTFTVDWQYVWLDRPTEHLYNDFDSRYLTWTVTKLPREDFYEIFEHF